MDPVPTVVAFVASRGGKPPPPPPGPPRPPPWPGAGPAPRPPPPWASGAARNAAIS